jgi:asparagine synthase (glutamine-hydrolysing)
MTMGASIECRVPFLDYRIVERLAELPTRAILGHGQRKAILRRAFADRLPPEVKRHRKWGFGIPWEKYLREQPELRALVQGLGDAEPIRSGPFERALVRNLAARFLAGENRLLALVKGLTMIALWHQALRAETTRKAAA